MRYQAIKQAVDEGLLPESALNQLDLYEDEDVNDEEIQSVQYNYSLFHIIFFLATQYVATLLTINVKQDDYGDFVPVGRTYFASWVKIISSWVCFVLYGWSLLAQLFGPIDSEFKFNLMTFLLVFVLFGEVGKWVGGEGGYCQLLGKVEI